MASKSCSACGKPVEEDASVCGACGAKLDAVDDAFRLAPEEAAKKEIQVEMPEVPEIEVEDVSAEPATPKPEPEPEPETRVEVEVEPPAEATPEAEAQEEERGDTVRMSLAEATKAWIEDSPTGPDAPETEAATTNRTPLLVGIVVVVVAAVAAVLLLL